MMPCNVIAIILPAYTSTYTLRREIIGNHHAHASPEKNRVLVVDDDEDIRWLFNLFLSNAGYQVEAAEDGLNALEKVKEKEFAIAVLDYVLPDMKGSQLAEKIAKIRPCLKIVFVTGYEEFAEEINSQLSPRSPRALIKPVTEEALIETVNAV